MRKLLLVGTVIGAVVGVVRRRRGSGGPRPGEPRLDHPEETIERLEREADVPGGIRP